MDQGELTDSFSTRPQGYAWFLGAGASRTSGLPTAADIINDLKRRFYCREENQEISRQDMQNSAVQTRIQDFMDSRGFPKRWADNEYTTYFEKIFGEDKERQRKYLRSILSEDRVTLTVGNRIIGALLASGLSRIAFTTNFDSVVERAFAEVSGRSLTAYHLEGSIAALQALNNEEFPLYCKLHGDFRYDSVKNLSGDLLQQDRQLADCLLSAASRFGFIVAGYSGRDSSVMSLFHEALTQTNPFPGGLFWTGIKDAPVLPAVTDLVAAAKSRGVNAQLVNIETFDALLLRLWRNIPNKPAHLDAKVRRTLPSAVNIPVSQGGSARPLIRMNALPVLAGPKKCLVVRVKRPVEWVDLRKMQHDAGGRLIFTKAAEVWCWGDREQIRQAFAGNLAEIAEQDLPTDISGPTTLHVKGFLEEAMVYALARGRPLVSRSHRTSSTLIANPHAEDPSPLDPIADVVGKLSGTIPGLFTQVTDLHPHASRVSWAEALRVSMVQKRGVTWLALDPDVWIWPPRARELATDFLDQRKRDRLNKRYNALLSAWVKLLIGSSERRAVLAARAFDDDDDAGNPTFVVGGQTGFAWRIAP